MVVEDLDSRKWIRVWLLLYECTISATRPRCHTVQMLDNLLAGHPVIFTQWITVIKIKKKGPILEKAHNRRRRQNIVILHGSIGPHSSNMSSPSPLSHDRYCQIPSSRKMIDNSIRDQHLINLPDPQSQFPLQEADLHYLNTDKTERKSKRKQKIKMLMWTIISIEWANRENIIATAMRLLRQNRDWILKSRKIRRKVVVAYCKCWQHKHQACIVKMFLF